MEYAFIAHSLSFSSNLLTNQLHRLTKHRGTRYTSSLQHGLQSTILVSGKGSVPLSTWAAQDKGFSEAHRNTPSTRCAFLIIRNTIRLGQYCPFLQGHMIVALNGAAANIAVKLTPKLTNSSRVGIFFYKEYVHICKCHRNQMISSSKLICKTENFANVATICCMK